MDAKIHLGLTPLSIATLPTTGSVYVLTDSQIEVYNRLGVQIAVQDCENFSTLAAWGDYLVLGTTEGDLVVVEPNQWVPVHSFASNLNAGGKVIRVTVNSLNLALVEVDNGYNHVV